MAALAARLDRLEAAAARPVLTGQDLTGALTPVLARLDALTGPVAEGVARVEARLAEVRVPTAAEVATAVGHEVEDRLLDQLAPRVADLVLTRVAASLVEQVADSVTTSVQAGLTEKVRAAALDSERRLSAHVDEAVLALAEALLRRRRGPKTLDAPPDGAPALDAGGSDPSAHGDLPPGSSSGPLVTGPGTAATSPTQRLSPPEGAAHQRGAARSPDVGSSAAGGAGPSEPPAVAAALPEEDLRRPWWRSDG